MNKEEIDKLVFALYYDFFCLIPKQNIKKAIKKYKQYAKKVLGLLNFQTKEKMTRKAMKEMAIYPWTGSS